MAVIDGEALWTSKKMLKVPPQYRAEYANLIPLQDCNGTFEFDPILVWRKVYSVNRQDVSVERVEVILKSFVDADMMSTWESDGKLLGRFVGSEKPGRLPSPSRRFNSKLPPPPEEEVERPRVEQKGLPYLKLIPKLCRELIGIRAENEEYYKKDLKELAETYGGTELVTAFEEWAKSLNTQPRNPVRDFIRVADGFLQNKIKADDPALDALCVSLYQLGQLPFTGKYRQMLNSLIREYSFAEIESAYKTFISNRDDYDMKFSVRDFCEGGAKIIILAAREKAKQIEQTKENIEAATKKEQQSVVLPEEEVPEEL